MYRAYDAYPSVHHLCPRVSSPPGRRRCRVPSVVRAAGVAARRAGRLSLRVLQGALVDIDRGLLPLLPLLQRRRRQRQAPPPPRQHARRQAPIFAEFTRLPCCRVRPVATRWLVYTRVVFLLAPTTLSAPICRILISIRIGGPHWQQSAAAYGRQSRASLPVFIDADNSIVVIIIPVIIAADDTTAHKYLIHTAPSQR